MKRKPTPPRLLPMFSLLTLLLHFGMYAHAQTNPLWGSTYFCHPDALRVAPTSKIGPDALRSVAINTTIYNTDFTSAGVGGLRNVGAGVITLSGVSGTVTKAYLYWHGETNSSTNVGNSIIVNGSPVSGTSIGVSSDNCWGFANSQAYRADVTTLVQLTGNGVYALSGFGAMNPNGASLIVFFDDGIPGNNRDVVIFEGNDSNIFFGGISGNPDAPADPAGWNVTLNGINYTSGTANIQLHVADGQVFPDPGLNVNNAVLLPPGQNFSGNTVPSANNGPGNNGSLWDIRTFNVTSFLSPGPNNLSMVTTNDGTDCLGLIVALVDLPSGAAPPPTCTINAKCKNATVTLVNGTATVSASAVDDGSTASCGIKSLTVSPNTFTCANAGDNAVTLTVTDNNGNVSTCTATVTVLGGPVSCSITSVPTDNTYTGGNPNILYLGYGAQSTTLQVTPSSGVTYSWSPSAGLSSTTSGAPVFTPTSPGTYTFTVTVTSAGGCTSTCSITVCVLDIRVPGTNGKKVYVCHYPPDNPDNYNTIMVSVNAVPSHIEPYPVGHNDKLGTCDQAKSPCGSAARILSPELLTGFPRASQGDQMRVSVLSNPSSSNFKMTVQSVNNDPVTILVSNIYGRRVYARNNVTPNTTLAIGEGFSQGVYYVEVRQGKDVRYLKLLKLN